MRTNEEKRLAPLFNLKILFQQNIVVVVSTMPIKLFLRILVCAALTARKARGGRVVRNPHPRRRRRTGVRQSKRAGIKMLIK